MRTTPADCRFSGILRTHKVRKVLHHNHRASKINRRRDDPFHFLAKRGYLHFPCLRKHNGLEGNPEFHSLKRNLVASFFQHVHDFVNLSNRRIVAKLSPQRHYKSNSGFGNPSRCS